VLFLVKKRHSTTTATRQILPRQQEHGVEVPAGRHKCRYSGTALSFESPPQANFLVMFPRSHWTIMPKMVHSSVALTQIVVKIDFKSNIGRFLRQGVVVVVAVLKGDTVKRGSNPKS